MDSMSTDKYILSVAITVISLNNNLLSHNKNMIQIL